jgi:hypothetical protein
MVRNLLQVGPFVLLAMSLMSIEAEEIAFQQSRQNPDN